MSTHVDARNIKVNIQCRISILEESNIKIVYSRCSTHVETEKRDPKLNREGERQKRKGRNKQKQKE
jgi:hypothetical protein